MHSPIAFAAAAAGGLRVPRMRPPLGALLTAVRACRYSEVGPAAFVGAGVLVLVIPVQVVCARKVGQYQTAAVTCTDARTRTMAEILKGILVRGGGRACRQAAALTCGGEFWRRVCVWGGSNVM